jgi:signal transduction histidine kinase
MSSIKDVVERMGGKVEGVSMVNRGSQFTFYLPYF